MTSCDQIQHSIYNLNFLLLLKLKCIVRFTLVSCLIVQTRDNINKLKCDASMATALHSNRVFKFRPVQYINLIEFKSIELEVKMKSSGAILELDSPFSFVRRTVKNFIASVDILFFNKILN